MEEGKVSTKPGPINHSVWKCHFFHSILSWPTFVYVIDNKVDRDNEG